MWRDSLNHLAIGAGLALCVLAVRLSSADEFRLTIGNPTAVMTPVASATPGAPPMKKLTNAAVFVVRVDGCPEPGKAQISATAEGIVGGVRRSVPITLTPMPTRGVYAVNRTWQPEGAWVVNLIGSYQNVKAGAVVPIAFADNGFVRGSSKFFSRAANPAEVDTALKAHAATAPPR